MTQEEYIQLYDKFLSGTCTPQEEARLMAFEDGFELLELPWEEHEMGNQAITQQAIFKDLEQSTRRSITPEKKYKRWLAVAAAVLVLAISAGAYVWLKNDRALTLAQQKSTTQPATIAPGKEKAMLTLADGSVLLLDDLANGQLSQQGQTTIVKKDGQIAYTAATAEDEKSTYNTIATPRGGQYKVVLPDGTNVWLNAASSLRFPTAFTGNTRQVELQGEAYFEVAKNKKQPFKVVAQQMEVVVLGTHFNVMAYKEEATVKTTLLEGAVQVGRPNENMRLQPGQQAVYHKNENSLVMNEANTDEAVAWKNGYFVFNNESIESIMRDIARWYDVEVVYEGDMEEKNFVGTVSRSQNMAEVLKVLELTGTVRFKVENRKITVMN